METTFKISGNWNDLKTKLKQNYSNLTDADLSYSAGQEDELVSRLAKKLGKTEMEVRALLDDLQGAQRKETSKTGTAQKGTAQTEKTHSDVAQEEDELAPMGGKEASKKYK